MPASLGELNQAIPTMRNTRPVVPRNADPSVFWDDEFYLWLLSQGSRYRNDPVYVEAASLISHTWEEPFVAGRSLCTPPATDLGKNYPSPNALIRDRWHGLNIVTTQTKSFDTAHPSGTLTIQALGKALPAGFVIGFPSLQYLQLTANAAFGATSLSVKKIWNDTNVTSGDIATPRNGYFSQQGDPSPRVRDMVLVGDPDPRINPGFETARKYACDGIAIEAMGANIENVLISNFPGHGLWINDPLAATTLASLVLPWDVIVPHVGYVEVERCLSGITIGSTDGKFDTLIASGCRDYGVRLKGFSIQGNKIHGFGSYGPGVWMENGGMVGTVEGESSDYGVDISGRAQCNSVWAYNNTYRGVLIDSYEVSIGTISVQHNSGATDSNYYPTGYALIVHGFSNRFTCPSIHLDAKNGSYGMLLGKITYDHTLEEVRVAGRITGTESPGDYGLVIGQPLNGSVVDMNVNGFLNNVWMWDAVTLAGNTLNFRGTSAQTIRWPNGVTGTFQTPNIPVAINNANKVNFHVY